MSHGRRMDELGVQGKPIAKRRSRSIDSLDRSRLQPVVSPATPAALLVLSIPPQHAVASDAQQQQQQQQQQQHEPPFSVLLEADTTSSSSSSSSSSSTPSSPLSSLVFVPAGLAPSALSVMAGAQTEGAGTQMPECKRPRRQRSVSHHTPSERVCKSLLPDFERAEREDRERRRQDERLLSEIDVIISSLDGHNGANVGVSVPLSSLSSLPPSSSSSASPDPSSPSSSSSSAPPPSSSSAPPSSSPSLALSPPPRPPFK